MYKRALTTILNNKTGFSLIEILVSAAILSGVLFGVITTFSDQKKSAKLTVKRFNAKKLLLSEMMKIGNSFAQFPSFSSEGNGVVYMRCFTKEGTLTPSLTGDAQYIVLKIPEEDLMKPSGNCPNIGRRGYIETHYSTFNTKEIKINALIVDGNEKVERHFFTILDR